MQAIRERLQPLIRQAVKCEGSYHPDDLLHHFEEAIYPYEVDPIYSFLKWVASNRKTFGWNLPEVYQQFLTEEAVK